MADGQEITAIAAAPRPAPEPAVGDYLNPTNYNLDVNGAYSALADLITATNTLIVWWNAWVPTTTGWEDRIEEVVGFADTLDMSASGFGADALQVCSGLTVTKTATDVEYDSSVSRHKFLDRVNFASGIGAGTSKLAVHGPSGNASFYVGNDEITGEHSSDGEITICGVLIDGGELHGRSYLSCDPVVKTSNFTASATYDHFWVDSSSNLTITLPSSSQGRQFFFHLDTAGGSPSITFKNPGGTTIGVIKGSIGSIDFHGIGVINWSGTVYAFC